MTDATLYESAADALESAWSRFYALAQLLTMGTGAGATPRIQSTALQTGAVAAIIRTLGWWFPLFRIVAFISLSVYV